MRNRVNFSVSVDTGQLSASIRDRKLEITLLELNQHSDFYQKNLSAKVVKFFDDVYEMGRIEALNEAHNKIDNLMQSIE